MVLECVSVHCFEDLDVRGCLACSSGKQNETETYVPVIKDGKYKRQRNNWLRLCVSCHRKYDYKRRKINK